VCTFAALPSTPSTAAPTRAEIRRAVQQLSALEQSQSALDEQYNLASYQLQQARAKVVRAEQAVATADAAHQEAVSQLSERVRAAYELGPGSELDFLFGARSVSALSDRAQFLNQIATNDQSVALQASVSGQRARWAEATLRRAAQARAAAVTSLAAKKAALVSSIAAQRSLIDRMKASLRQAILARRAERRHQAELQRERLAREAAARAAAARHQTAPPSSSPGHSTGGWVPPANASQAQIAISAAESQLGVPYVYAAAEPGVGFDCSGLTMWAWRQAGVSLPHVAALQYADLPHVSRSQLQPGDLVFFYSPIHHVGIYIGGGMMIDAPHTGAYVEKTSVYWSVYSGAARP
jgi:peptidoglycan DL-endopeptidase CwlO